MIEEELRFTPEQIKKLFRRYCKNLRRETAPAKAKGRPRKLNPYTKDAYQKRIKRREMLAVGLVPEESREGFWQIPGRYRLRPYRSG